MKTTQRILVGDVREKLRELADQSVHCVVTSPPYFSLRDYGTARWEGGDPDCDHGVHRWDRPKQTQGAQSGHASKSDRLAREQCACGAVRIDTQIGLEPTLADYLQTMVEVFREVRRVLRDDGTLWLNIGDSYAGSWGAQGHRETPATLSRNQINNHPKRASMTGAIRDAGLKPKDLMLVPARLALALQADGWWIRSDIIWAKKAAMPESCSDRPTSAHEHIFLLTKQPRYFYDIDAVREPLAESSVKRLTQETFEQQTGGEKDYAVTGQNDSRSARRVINNLHEKLVRQEKWKSRQEGWEARDKSIGANLRNVWHLGPEPFPDAHFATFVTEIPRRAIKAGTSERGVCPDCGAPWVRVTERSPMEIKRTERGQAIGHDFSGGRTATSGTMVKPATSVTTGWEPSCSCDAGDPCPATVLDPFLGSGTTLLVADQLGRNGIGIELNPEYAAMARKRIHGAAPMFATVQIA